MLNAPVAGFISASADARTTISLFQGVEEQGVREYVEHYAARNEWVRHLPGPDLHGPDCGEVIVDSALVRMPELRKTEFYNDYLTKYQVARSIGVRATSSNDTVTYLSLMRSERHGDWPVWAEALLQALLPHLQRAISIHQQLSRSVHAQQVYRHLLDGFAAPVIVVDGAQRVLAANSRGSNLLRARDGLRDNDGRIEAAHRDDRQALSRVIATAMNAIRRPWSSHGPHSVRLRREGERPPLTVLAAPAPSGQAPIAEATVLFVLEPPSISGASVDILRLVYGLTPAEARVAALTQSGRGAGWIAHVTRSTPETVRKHLRRIFHKTGTKNQQDLAWLIGTLPR